MLRTEADAYLECAAHPTLLQSKAIGNLAERLVVLARAYTQGHELHDLFVKGLPTRQSLYRFQRVLRPCFRVSHSRPLDVRWFAVQEYPSLAASSAP